VESLFIKHFAGNDRTVAMKYLKPQHPKSRHMTTFLIGAWIQIQNSCICHHIGGGEINPIF
jgi:hypothetical protein